MENDERKLAIHIGNVIKSNRKRLKLTQKELGERVGVSNSAIANYEKGFRSPFQDTLFALSEVFGISVNDFYPDVTTGHILIDVYNQLTPPRQDNVYTYAVNQLEEQKLDEEADIYIVGQTAAGTPLSYGDSNINKINAHIPKGADYALTVKGDSMEPLIENGSIIFYKEQPTLENGEIGIIEVNRDEVTCKKFYRYDDKVVLKSINEKYEDITLKDVPVRVIGKVILNERKEV